MASSWQSRKPTTRPSRTTNDLRVGRGCGSVRVMAKDTRTTREKITAAASVNGWTINGYDAASLPRSQWREPHWTLTKPDRRDLDALRLNISTPGDRETRGGLVEVGCINAHIHALFTGPGRLAKVINYLEGN